MEGIAELPKSVKPRPWMLLVFAIISFIGLWTMGSKMTIDYSAKTLTIEPTLSAGWFVICFFGVLALLGGKMFLETIQVKKWIENGGTKQ